MLRLKMIYHRVIQKEVLFSAIILFSLLFLAGFKIHQNPVKITDKAINQAVNRELRLNSTTPAYLIDVETNEGIVKLTGTVMNIRAKDRAAAIAETVKGVRAVVSEIEVNAPFMADAELEAEIRDELIKDPATDSYELYIDVNNGIVTISGIVQSFQEKELAEFVAKGVMGVRGIENNISVNYDVERKDEEIKKEIVQTLRNDNRIDDGAVFVTVDEGKVSLSGVVGSAAERSLASSLARTIGVNAVNTDSLEVKKWARDPDLRKAKYAVRSDIEIREAVRDAFIYDPRVHSFNPEINVKEGVVTLSGNVDNLKAREAAEQDARNVVGVFHVNNNLKVKPPEIPQDNALESEINNEFQEDPIVEKWKIEVLADNGVVYLNGTVNSPFEKLHARDIVSRTKGVVEVKNNLKVYEDDPLFFDYYGWNSYFPPYQVNAEGTNIDDSEIEKAIEDHLWWSPYINEDEIEVSVKNGEAILEGEVATRREKKFAEISAMEGGANDVENNIKIISDNHNQ